MIDLAKLDRNAGPAASRQGDVSSAEAEGKRDEFRKVMREHEGEGETGRRRQEADRGIGDQKDEKAEAFLPPPFSGDALLHGLGDSYAPETQGVTDPGLVQDATALVTELADRILVNTDTRAAGGEVRISLKDSVLPDTEIILRQEGERLAVQLVSGNPASLEALHQAREDLRNKLLPLDLDISVEVLDSRAQGDGGGSGHSGGRSRGLDYFTGSEG